MYSYYPIKIDSLFSSLKWLASWVWFPWVDAYRKVKKINKSINGFDLFVLSTINIVNRIGSAVQRNII